MIRGIIFIAVLLLITAQAFPGHGASPPRGPFTIKTLKVCISHSESKPICRTYTVKPEKRDVFKTLAACQKTGRADSINLAHILALKHFPGKRGVRWISLVPCRKIAKEKTMGITYLTER